MAASATLRRVEEPPRPPRSAERQSLAEAAGRHREASERLQRLRAALSQARRDASDRFSDAERAEEELAEAKQREPHRRAAELLGEAAPIGVSAAEAQRVLTAARASYDEIRDVAGVLEVEINGSGGIDGAEARVSYAQSAVDRALAAVIAADPALAKLIEAFDSARAEVAAMSEVFKFIGLTRLPPELQTWFAENRALPPCEPRVPAWKDAIDALRQGKADAPLPGS